MTEWNDRTRGGKELLAFVDSGAVDNVFPKSVCTEYPLEATSKSQSGVGFVEANGSHIKHFGQRHFRVKTSTANNVNTWDVADVRKQLISASRVLELVLDEKPRIQCKNGDTIPHERTVRLWIPKGFSQAGLNTNRIMKRKPVRPYTEGRTRNTHAVWPVTDASDRLDVDMDEFVDPDGFGATRWAQRACWQHHELQRKLDEKSMMCFTCLIALGVDLVSWKGIGETPSDTVATVTMTDPQCLLTTFTSAETQHHCQLQRTDAPA